MSGNDIEERGGPIAWMARNPVASTTLMVLLLIGGGVSALRIKQEVFPEFSLDIITIAVPFPGSSPDEVERGIVMPVEEAVRDIDGLDKITSVAAESSGTVTLEFVSGTDMSRALSDVKSAVDALKTLPEDSETARISIIPIGRNLMDVVVYGELDEHNMRVLADELQHELLEIREVTKVDINGVRPREIAIEVPSVQLREYGLTLDGVANAVRSHSNDISGGGVDTPGGEVLLRVQERKDLGSEYLQIPVASSADGSSLLLGEIATVSDGFAETNVEARYGGKRAVLLKIYSSSDSTPVEAADKVAAFMAEREKTLPPGVHMAVFNNTSEVYKERLDLLLKNALWGLLIVVIVLGLFLNIKLAFWVTMGIPVSFLGAVFLLPWFDASINMISLMAFIMALGMLVDDAIVVGENIYTFRQKGYPFLKAAIEGTRAVAVPVTFAILTNIVAFLPLLFIHGIMGRILWVVPTVVVSAFVVSLVEALFILPAHLSHSRRGSGGFLSRCSEWFQLKQQRVADASERAIKGLYRPVVDFALRNRYFVTAAGVALLIVVGAWVGSNRIKMVFMEAGEESEARAAIELRHGAPVEETRLVATRIEGTVIPAIVDALAKYGVTDGRPERWVEGVYRVIGMAQNRGFHGGSAQREAGVTVYLVDQIGDEKRPFIPSEFTTAWRARNQDIAGIKNLAFTTKEVGPPGGEAINVSLMHRDPNVLETAAGELANELRSFPQAKDIDNGLALGKPQLDFRVTSDASAMGLTARAIGGQLRSAFYGAEARRFQRGRDEVKVMVRLPREERRTELSVEDMLIRTPAGTDVPLREVAEVTFGHAYTKIDHLDTRRIVKVTADVYPPSQANAVMKAVVNGPLKELEDKYMGLSHSVGGRQQEFGKSMGSLGAGFLIAVITIFGMLAVVFRSYIQPLIIMVAIPFGIIGAVIGHEIMGFNLTLLSMMGIVALSGVVVNDSLVMIDLTNTNRRAGMSALEAVRNAGLSRLRPILLTTFTTFFGLMPMLLETSPHIRMLQPMAISLGFGVLFSTTILLLIVPSLYVITEDVKGSFGIRVPSADGGDSAAVTENAAEGQD